MVRAIALALLVGLLLIPLAVSAPLAYVGQGSGTIEPPSGLTEGCDRAEMTVAVYPKPDGWFLQAHSVDTGASETVGHRHPCNYRHQIPTNGGLHEPIDFPFFGTARLEGSPETGFTLDFSDECGVSLYEFGPLGPATEFRHTEINLCGPSNGNSWINATLSFQGFG